MRKKVLSLLVLLCLTVSSAWATDFTVKELTASDISAWNDDNTVLTAADLNGFQAVTQAEAEAWADVPTSGNTLLIYAFSNGEVQCVNFLSGTNPGVMQGSIPRSALNYFLQNGYRIFYTAAATYTVTVKDGTEDADKWTANPNPAEAGQTVTVTYSGTKKVKSVKAKKK